MITDSERLKLLKADLNISTNARDDYLIMILSAARNFIATEGITLSEEDTGDDMLLIMYAAYLYRHRQDKSNAMPRMLRWALNNRLMQEKGAT